MRSAAVVLVTAVSFVLALVGAAVALAGPAAAAGTSYTWSGDGASDAWTDSANWSPAGVPGTGDSVLVEAPSDDVCHAHVTDVPVGVQLADLTVDERAYHGDPDSPCLTSLDGGSITVSSAFTLHAGEVGSAVTIAAGATGSITPGSVHDAPHIGAGGLIVDGSLNLNGNTDVENLSLTGGPGITVDAGATLTAQGTNTLVADCCLNPAHLLNRGTVQLSGDLTLHAVELDQDAVVNAVGGAQLVTDFAPQTAGDGATWTGSGAWQMHQGDITASGTQTLAAGFSWILGGNGSTSDERLHGTFTLAGSGRFDWDGGTVAAAMTFGKSITALAAGSPAADPRRLDGVDGDHPVALTNHGALTFATDGGWYAINSGRIVNASDGTLTLTPGLTASGDCCSTSSPAVVSSGRVAVPAPTGPATTVALDDIGYRTTGVTTIAATASLALTGGSAGSLSTATVGGGGSFSIAEPMTAGGRSTVAGSTTVVLADRGSITANGRSGATLAGTGNFQWTGGTLAGTVTLSTAGGQTVSGTAAAKEVTGTSAGVASTVTFTGPTTVAAGTTKALDTVHSGSGATLRFTGTLTLAGNTTFTGGTIVTTGATTVAAGSSSAYLASGAALTTSGTLTVSSGTLKSDSDIVQTAGTTTVASGATVRLPDSSKALRITGGTVTGAGQVAGNVAVGAGTLAPGAAGPGTFTVTGSLTTAGGSTLQLELGSGTRDRISVGGTAKLVGTLRLIDLPGYQPATGDVVTVVTAHAASGSFTCTTTTGDGATTEHWAAKVTSAKLQLTSKAGPPTSC